MGSKRRHIREKSTRSGLLYPASKSGGGRRQMGQGLGFLTEGQDRGMKKKKFYKDYLEPIILAVLIALFIRTFIIQAFKIPSGSMEPTLLVGDYLLVNKFIYGIKIPFTETKVFRFVNPRRGDIIVFPYPRDPSKDFIKRVIGMGGEKVEIIRGQIYVNDRLIPDPWGHFEKIGPSDFLQRIENFGPVVVPEDSLFVMGDNRNNSEDSRFWGFLRVNTVVGKAFILYFSWNSNAENLLNRIRWSRVGKLIH
jgi:signal peptidase I